MKHKKVEVKPTRFYVNDYTLGEPAREFGYRESVEVEVSFWYYSCLTVLAYMIVVA